MEWLGTYVGNIERIPGKELSEVDKDGHVKPMFVSLTKTINFLNSKWPDEFPSVDYVFYVFSKNDGIPYLVYFGTELTDKSEIKKKYRNTTVTTPVYDSKFGGFTTKYVEFFHERKW